MIDREFRIGDRVTCVLFGKGIIERVSVKFIDVKFENGRKEVYYKDGKYTEIMNRTLFIIQPQKPTLKQIKEKYKQLLDEVEEVEFIEGGSNWFLDFYYCSLDCVYKINKEKNNHYYYLNIKYISLDDAEKIINEMEKFIEGE